MSKNFFGHSIRWVWTMKKINTPLSVSSYLPGVKMSQRIFNYPVHISATWYDQGDIYFDEEEIVGIRQFIRHYITNDARYPDKIAQRIRKIHQLILAQTISKNKLTKVSIESLLKLWQTENRLFLQMIGFMSYRGSIQISEVLQERFEDILILRLAQRNKLPEINNYRELLSIPLNESSIVEEQRGLLRAAKGFKMLSEKGKIKRVQEYCFKFEWLRYHWFIGTAFNEQEVRHNFEKASATAAAHLKKLDRQRKSQELKINQTVRFLKFTKSDLLVYRQYREWLLLRTFVKDSINFAGYKLLPILHAIANKSEIPRENISLFTFDEINRINSLTQQAIKKIIAERKDGFSAGIVENKFSFRVFSKPKSNIEPFNESDIKGRIAFRGTCRGVARVLTSPREQDRVKDGEILVVSMTTPDYLPAMKRAAAFVTDEGGITCHAAIVGREMKKPCIIGTKNATKIFQDGDMVEVDGEQGIVRKI